MSYQAPNINTHDAERARAAKQDSADRDVRVAEIQAQAAELEKKQKAAAKITADAIAAAEQGRLSPTTAPSKPVSQVNRLQRRVALPPSLRKNGN